MIRMDKEVELLLACSRPQMDSVSADGICRLLQEEIDWNWMLKAARSHGVWPIMYHNLKAVCPEAVPQDILSKLKNVYLDNALRNLLLIKELFRIIEDFQNHGIEAVPFKGPALARMAYGDVTQRSFSDLDIMVRKQNVLQARDLLQSAGYKPEIPMTSDQEVKYLKANCEYNFNRQSPNVHVEIHWAFLPTNYYAPFDERIWSRLETMTFEGTRVQSFSSDDLVLALCAHATKHQWFQIKMVSDLAGLISRHQIDWDQVVASADEMGLMRILHIGLFLAHDLLDAKLPEQMLYKIEKDNTAKKMALHISEKLFSETNGMDGIIERYLFWPRTRERLSDRVKYLLFVGFEPTQADYDAFPMPDFLNPFYWIVRPVRLFYQYGLKKRI